MVSNSELEVQLNEHDDREQPVVVNAHEYIEVLVLRSRDHSTVQHVYDVHQAEGLEDHRVVLVFHGVGCVSKVFVNNIVLNLVEHGSEVQKCHDDKGLVDSLEPDGSTHDRLEHFWAFYVFLEFGKFSWVRGFGSKSTSGENVHN